MLQILEGHINSIKQMGLSADNSILISGSDEEIKAWKMDYLFKASYAYHFSLKELHAWGVQLEPEDLLTLRRQGGVLSEPEIRLIGNMTK